MKPPEKKYWFPAKTYGWGWGPPVCWQGWVTFAIWTTLQIGSAVWVITNPVTHRSAFHAITAILGVGLIAICWWKGEPPRWRWGKEPDKDGK